MASSHSSPDLDRSKGRLRLAGRMDHVIYLDAFTLRLATAWELQRHRCWPDSSNSYFFVTQHPTSPHSGRGSASDSLTPLGAFA
ncbi:hypothetical protein [Streptomyces sp. NPDC054797]